jgi:hypothetical protein
MERKPILKNTSIGVDNYRFGKFVNKATFAKNLGVVFDSTPVRF